MIYGNINYLADESHYPKKVYEVLKLMKEYNYDEMEDQVFEVEGRDVFMTLTSAKTQVVEERRPETHKKYLDIQLIIEGKEKIGTAVLTEKAVTSVEYNPETDLEFYLSVENETLVSLKAGDFLVLFPEDIHRPLCANDEPSDVRKIIAKIAVDVL